MIDQKLLDEIKKTFVQKDTDELLSIWEENNQADYSTKVFKVISEILTDRGVSLPQQKDSAGDPYYNHPRTKWTTWFGEALILIGIAMQFLSLYIAVSFFQLEHVKDFIGATPNWGGFKNSILQNFILVVGFSFLLTGYTIRTKSLKLDFNQTSTKWGTGISFAFIPMLCLSGILGYLAADESPKEAVLNLSYFLLFPLYVLVDSLFNARFLQCTLRAVILPFVLLLALWHFTIPFPHDPSLPLADVLFAWHLNKPFNDDAIGTTAITASLYLGGSALIVRLLHVIRKKRMKLAKLRAEQA